MSEELEIRLPRVEDEPGVRAAQAELAEDDFEFGFFLDDTPDFAAWVERCAAGARGERLEPGWVRNSLLLGLVDGQVVGRVSVRHELNARLRADGGHIGYGVRPGFRGHGHAAALLEHALDLLASEGVAEAMVVAHEDNEASRRIIERAGGVLDGTDARPPKRGDGEADPGYLRFWIDLT